GAGAGSIEGAQVKQGAVTLFGTNVTQTINGALDLSRIPRREGHAMDGILGNTFIDRWVVEIEYVNQQLLLYDPRTFHFTGAGTSLPITFHNNHPYVDGAVRLADGERLPGAF